MFRAILLIALVGLLAAAQPGRGNADRDPTRPPGGLVSRPVVEQSSTVPELTSVLVGEHRRLAVIDGKLMAEGEERFGLKVWQIKADRVVVSIAGSEPVTLMLDTARVHKELR